MKKGMIRNLLIIIILFLELSQRNSLLAQNCYISLFNGTGYEPSTSLLMELEAAACNLRDSFPPEYRDSFKVFDYGYYRIHEYTTNGYLDSWYKAIGEASSQSKYYLLFGKLVSENSANDKYWLAMNLPKSSHFSCMNNFQRERYKQRIISKALEEQSKYNSHQTQYIKQEIAGIKELTKIIQEIKECCLALRQNPSKRSSGGCSSCDDEETNQFFQQQGFEKINLIRSPASFSNINSENIKDYSFHKANLSNRIDYIGNILNKTIDNFNKWVSFKLIVTSNSSMCIDSISDVSQVNYSSSSDFVCQINFPSEAQIRPDFKITWTRKPNTWITSDKVANLVIKITTCKILTELEAVNENCLGFIPIHPSKGTSHSMPGFDVLYPIYLLGQNKWINDTELTDAYNEFGGDDNDALPDPEINNGIEIISSSVANTIPRTGRLFAQSLRDHPNVEDLQYGTNGDCSGIRNNCMKFASLNTLDPLEEEDLKNHMISLMSFFSKPPLKSIAISFAQRFFSKIKTDHYAIDLASFVKESPNMRNYIKQFGDRLSKEILLKNGFENIVQALSLNFRPKFRGNYNKWHGLTILLNDTEETKIWYLGNYKLNDTTKIWTADFYFEVTDHFGLDKDDVLKFQNYHIGFAAWWVLQHRKNFPPFRTKLPILVTLKGKL